MLNIEETIVAIASASGSAMRGIVRITGPDSLAAVRPLFEPEGGWPSEFKRAESLEGELRVVASETNQDPMATVLSVPATALIWPDERSYTRQPSVEFHLVGSMPVLELVVEAVCRGGARLAEAGEFTLRAFLSGRIDLTQAEAVLAVIDAESESQFETALQQLAGGIGGPLGTLRDRLLSVLAELEAGLDFVEEDIEFISDDQLQRELRGCREQLESVMAQIDQRDVVSDLPTVTLMGKPNAGKSSLLNSLVETERAIVTDVAGTTTDYLSVVLELGTKRVNLIDTAGEEEAIGTISVEAQAHRSRQAKQSDLRILCIDVANVRACFESPQKLVADLSGLQNHDVLVISKMDLLEPSLRKGLVDDVVSAVQRLPIEVTVVPVSSQEGEGLEGLKLAIESGLQKAMELGESVSVVGSTIRRAADSLRLAADSLAAAIEAAEFRLGEEIVAAEIRESLNALGLVVGAIYTDDILDLVFGRFCIGK